MPKGTMQPIGYIVMQHGILDTGLSRHTSDGWIVFLAFIVTLC